MILPCFAQGIADVRKPEEVLHMLRQLQTNNLAQAGCLAQAAAESNSLKGAAISVLRAGEATRR